MHDPAYQQPPHTTTTFARPDLHPDNRAGVATLRAEVSGLGRGQSGWAPQKVAGLHTKGEEAGDGTGALRVQLRARSSAVLRASEFMSVMQARHRSRKGNKLSFN